MAKQVLVCVCVCVCVYVCVSTIVHYESIVRECTCMHEYDTVRVCLYIPCMYITIKSVCTSEKEIETQKRERQKTSYI